MLPPEPAVPPAAAQCCVAGATSAPPRPPSPARPARPPAQHCPRCLLRCSIRSLPLRCRPAAGGALPATGCRCGLAGAVDLFFAGAAADGRLAVWLAPLAAPPTAVATAGEFTGRYGDLNHPGCWRTVGRGAAGGELAVAGVDPGAASGSGSCDGVTDVPWAESLSAEVDGQRIAVDFQPRGGGLLVGALRGQTSGRAGIRWADGNFWPRLGGGAPDTPIHGRAGGGAADLPIPPWVLVVLACLLCVLSGRAWWVRRRRRRVSSGAYAELDHAELEAGEEGEAPGEAVAEERAGADKGVPGKQGIAGGASEMKPIAFSADV